MESITYEVDFPKNISSVPNDLFPGWDKPKKILGTGSSAQELQVHLLRDEFTTSLRFETDKNRELSSLLLLLATDAKRMQINANNIIQEQEEKIQILSEEAYNNESRIHQLHLDVELFHAEVQNLMERDIQQKRRNFELQETIQNMTSTLQLQTAEYTDTSNELQAHLKAKESEVVELQKQVLEMNTSQQALQLNLEQTHVKVRDVVQQQSTIRIVHVFETARRRYLSLRLSQWRSKASYMNASTLAHQQYKKQHQQLLSEHNYNIQLLEKQSAIALEEQRRKYVRIYDSRNLLVFDLIRCKRNTAHQILSQWKNKLITSLLTKLGSQQLAHKILEDAVEDMKKRSIRLIMLLLSSKIRSLEDIKIRKSYVEWVLYTQRQRMLMAESTSVLQQDKQLEALNTLHQDVEHLRSERMQREADIEDIQQKYASEIVNLKSMIQEMASMHAIHSASAAVVQSSQVSTQTSAPSSTTSAPQHVSIASSDADESSSTKSLRLELEEVHQRLQSTCDENTTLKDSIHRAHDDIRTTKALVVELEQELESIHSAKETLDKVLLNISAMNASSAESGNEVDALRSQLVELNVKAEHQAYALRLKGTQYDESCIQLEAANDRIHQLESLLQQSQTLAQATAASSSISMHIPLSSSSRDGCIMSTEHAISAIQVIYIL
jgi:hypothetical protein